MGRNWYFRDSWYWYPSKKVEPSASPSFEPLLCHRHGIGEVLINTHAHGGQVRSYVAAQRNGLKATVVEEPVLLGSAGTILANREWVAGERCFWILYADVLTNANLKQMMEFHEEHGQLATLGGYEVPARSAAASCRWMRKGMFSGLLKSPNNRWDDWHFPG